MIACFLFCFFKNPTYEAQASDVSQFLTILSLSGYWGRGARKLGGGVVLREKGVLY